MDNELNGHAVQISKLDNKLVVIDPNHQGYVLTAGFSKRGDFTWWDPEKKDWETAKMAVPPVDNWQDIAEDREQKSGKSSLERKRPTNK